MIERASQQPKSGSRFLGLAAAAVVLTLAGIALMDMTLFSRLTRMAEPRVATPPAPRVAAAPPVVPPPVAAPPVVTPPALPKPEIPRAAPLPSPSASATVPPAPVAAPAKPLPASTPTILVARPPGAQPATAPFADADVTQVVTRQIRRFNESRDVAEKQDATRQILAAALIGHPLARTVIVAAYRTSTLVQGIATPADVVRLGLDFAVRGSDETTAARSFAALASDLAGRDPAGFGRAVLDAMRDDPRLRTGKPARSIIDSLSSSPQACAALAVAAGNGAAACDGGLAALLGAQAEVRGPAGQESAAYKAAERAFARYLQDAL